MEKSNQLCQPPDFNYMYGSKIASEFTSLIDNNLEIAKLRHEEEVKNKLFQGRFTSEMQKMD